MLIHHSFSARLPEQCDSINKKLGGPVMLAPPKPRPKPKRTDSGTSKNKSKAEGINKRVASSGQKYNLENVLSRESMQHRRSMSRGPGGMIALMRSASTPVLLGMKREASEPAPIGKIPPTSDEIAPQSPDTSSAHGVKRKLGDDRAKKDAQVQAELKNAISALRRPNREVAGHAIMEDAERRATTTLSQLKSKFASVFFFSRLVCSDNWQNLGNRKCILACRASSRPHQQRHVSRMCSGGRPLPNPLSVMSTDTMHHLRPPWSPHLDQGSNNGL